MNREQVGSELTEDSEPGPFKIMSCRIIMKLQGLMNENKKKIVLGVKLSGERGSVRIITSHSTYIAIKLCAGT